MQIIVGRVCDTAIASQDGRPLGAVPTGFHGGFTAMVGRAETAAMASARNLNTFPPPDASRLQQSPTIANDRLARSSQKFLALSSASPPSQTR